MKDFTYDKSGLQIDACSCLEDLGLRETRWILDATWFLNNSNHPTFKEWIVE